MAVRVGAPDAGGLTVKESGALVPPAVVTVTFRAPTAAAASSVKLAVSDVALPTTTVLTVTPVPATVTVVAPTTKLVPVSVTATVAPWVPCAGAMAVRVGAAGGRPIVKVCPPLVPVTVVTVTVRGPSVAVGSSTKLAVSDVALPTTTLAIVTPPPATVTVVAPPTKLVPVSVTATVVPRMP